MMLIPTVLWIHGAYADSFMLEEEEQQQCRLIFSINPGRSGSTYLARLLSLSDRVDAGHERVPVMAERTLRRAKQRGLEATYQERSRRKVPAIRRRLDAIHHNKVYAETSHLFAKTFADVVMDAFVTDHALHGYKEPCRVDVIVLQRDLLDTACSFFVHNWTRHHADWLIEPWSALATLPADARACRPSCRGGEDSVRAREADLIFWYLYDTAEKAKDFANTWGVLRPDKAVHVHTFRLEELQNLDGVERMLRQLDLGRGIPSQNMGRARAVIGRPLNSLNSRRSRNRSNNNNKRMEACPRAWLAKRLAAFQEQRVAKNRTHRHRGGANRLRQQRP